ncbi:MAG: hypothetical protein GOVbin7744_17 [Prokaryotic dsDNA virus sp.]|nr:MAG: hypothetical protein GOVbin7744_17 [Prokaryotic dsDNA virus sp.]|tara:strand:- start:1870 stop:2280 length:411 start_codon:yes stop_codon:yes gene_type:complete
MAGAERKAGRLNMPSGFDDEIHNLLTEWGNWARTDSLLNKPKHALYRMMSRIIDDERPPSVDDMNDKTLVIERAVARLKTEKDKRLLTLIKRYYLSRWDYIQLSARFKLSEQRIKEMHARALRLVRVNIILVNENF